ncbi:hypothetical protein MAR_003755 [Mya arenaria]|uniref:Uncharacterized protein n=1 Tax=Mya arenaria TaxID=6604 RepID=A0ABY7G6Y1_MYAAR|nr:hypothetical protein MAR_003755 [Mya arenaria]
MQLFRGSLSHRGLKHSNHVMTTA